MLTYTNVLHRYVFNFTISALLVFALIILLILASHHVFTLISFIFPLHTSSCILFHSSLPLLYSSTPWRLLKVKPEERLTIEGVLAHPWLNCTEALDNVLPSAQMMMDKVSGKFKGLTAVL